MSTAHRPIKLFETVVDQCPYLEDQESASIIVDPDHQIDPALFSLLSRSGFRRSGTMLYSPRCPSCQECISVRIPVDRFKPSKTQKRILKRNLDLRVQYERVEFEQSHFDLYLKYQKHRHPDSSMCDDDPWKYISFIDSYYSQSNFLSFYLNDQLIAASVVDHFQGGISAVYTYFDPEFAKRSLGTYAILYMIKQARMRQIPYVYLGYWVRNSEKMAYKSAFKPLEGYFDRKWSDLTL
jgi:arginine-tRNA-protein transferase